MSTAFDRLLARAKAVERATASGGPLAALEDYFGVAEAAIKSESIIQRVGRRPELIALVRRILEDGWSRSGLNKNSKTGHGRLYAAGVKDAIISATAKGIRIAIPPGLADTIYKWAGAMLYGAVHGPREQHEIRDTVTGKINAAKSAIATSVLGAAAKRSIKKAAFAGRDLSARSRKRIESDSVLRNGANAGAYTQRRGVKLGEVHVRAAHKFWNFAGADYDAVAELWIQLLMQEVGAVLKAHRALRGRIAKLSA